MNKKKSVICRAYFIGFAFFTLIVMLLIMFCIYLNMHTKVSYSFGLIEREYASVNILRACSTAYTCNDTNRECGYFYDGCVYRNCGICNYGYTCNSLGKCILDSTSKKSCKNVTGCIMVGKFCDGSMTYFCKAGVDGCLKRVNDSSCISNQICVSGYCVANKFCSNDTGCSVAGKFCDGNRTYSCAAGSDGCLDRVNWSICAKGYYCDSGQCKIEQSIPLKCSNDDGCSRAGTFCEDSIPYNCILAESGCYERINKTICLYNQQCINGACINKVCIINCTGKVCGSNGCSGTCSPGCSSGYSCNSIGACEARMIRMTRNITQFNITWFFDKEYEYGQFANGDYWVKTDERKIVNIIRITPDFFNDGTYYHHGWEVNPNRYKQGFDSRSKDTWWGSDFFLLSLVPTLPYSASANQSIVKVISREPYSDAGLRPVLKTSAVLTVLGETPENNGATVFRPPYLGTDKKLYSTNNLNWGILPSLPLSGSVPSLENFMATGSMRGMQLDYFNGGGAVDYMHPSDNMPNDGGAIATRNGNIALRLMLNDSVESKKNLTIAYIQQGIDLYYAGIGGTRWSPDGQIFIGRKLPITFASVMLNNENMKNFVKNADDMQFQENGIFHQGKNEVLWSLNKSTYWNEWRYWSELINTPDDGGKVGSDPYGYIDGSSTPGETYLTSGNAMQSKRFALAIRLMPELREVWDDEELLRFADRWTYIGVWTQPDLCAPPTGICKAGTLKAGQPCTMANANFCNNGGLYDCDYPALRSQDYGIKYGPNSTNPGNCIRDIDSSDGIGRVPWLHGRNKNNGQGSAAWTEAMWNTYRGESCFNGYCNATAGETINNCPYDCGSAAIRSIPNNYSWISDFLRIIFNVL
jgi:hypothetical protein